MLFRSVSQSRYPRLTLSSTKLEVVKSMDSSKAIAFASEMQKLHFIGGKNLSDSTVYKELLQKMDLSESVFYAGLASEDFKKKAFEIFESSQKLGVSGYPAVLALIQGKYYLVSNGFVPENELFELLEKVKTIQ